MPKDNPCPDVGLLRTLMSGRLSDWEAAPLEQHVSACVSCNDRIQSFAEDDHLLLSLRGPTTAQTDCDDPFVDEIIDRVRQITELSTLGSGGPMAGGGLATRCDDPQLQRIGSFILLKQLGSGGMGVVYLARDERLKRLVAIKMLLMGMPTSQDRLARFRREAELIAQLHHPNIVQILEVGELNGQPWYAMEYLEEGSLAHRLAGRPLRPSTAVRLVARLARAVEAAHALGIVHRDLKPANVLLVKRSPSDAGLSAGVDDDLQYYEPKITDFGLAKQMSGDASENFLPGRTHSGDILGTPSYMAPEQALGDQAAIGPATDVYALGVILYECLTGRPPFQAATPLETLEQVRSQEPIAPGRLQPGLSRDLDTICLRCLEKSPSRRYDSAANLADDLDRFLADEPILARPISRAERWVKWARRKPTAASIVAAAALFSVAAVAGTVAHNARLRVAATEAKRQQERAESQYRDARDTLRQMLERISGRDADQIPKLQELRREQQEDALAFFLKTATQHGDDPGVRFDVAQALHQAALLQSTLGRFEEARQNGKRAERELAALSDDFPDQPEYRLHHIHTLKLLGGYTRVSTEESREYLERAVTMASELVQSDGDSEKHQTAEADARITLGSFIFTQHGKEGVARAEEHYRRAATIYENLIHEQPDNATYQFVLAKTYLNLSVLMQNSDRPPHEFHDKAEATLERAYREKPTTDVADSLAVLRLNWAYVQQAENKSEQAIDALAKSIAMLSGLLEREPNHAMLRDRLYRSYGLRAEILGNQNRFAESAADWQQALEFCPFPTQGNTHRPVMAMALARSGQHEQAAGAIEEWQRHAGPNPSADQLIQCARVFAAAFEAADRDGAGESVDGVANRYRSRAIEFLARAKSSLGEAWGGQVRGIRSDEAFRPLDGNAEFERLVAP